MRKILLTLAMNKQRGFTLIKLLVVIAIIALLLAILMPSLQRVKKQARRGAKLPFCRLVCQKSWTERIVEIEVASRVRHGGPLD